MHVTEAEYSVLMAADRITYCATHDAMYVLSEEERAIRAEADNVYAVALARHEADHIAWVNADAAGRIAIELADADNARTMRNYPIQRRRHRFGR